MSKNNSQSGFLKLRVVVFLAVVSVLIYSFPSYCLLPVGHVLQLDQTPEKADAIVILLGDNSPERVLRAFQLYRQGFATLLVFTSGFSPELAASKPSQLRWISNGARYQAALRSLGVRSRDILILPDDDAFDTAEELQRIADYGRIHAWSRVLLVTSVSHSRRTDLIWSRVGSEIMHQTIAAPEFGFPNWWEHQYSRKRVYDEYGALIKEIFYQMSNQLLGLNKEVRRLQLTNYVEE